MLQKCTILFIGYLELPIVPRMPCKCQCHNGLKNLQKKAILQMLVSCNRYNHLLIHMSLVAFVSF